MGIDFFIPNSNQQANSTATKLSSYQESYANLQASVNKFVSDTESLQGQAYDNARLYFSSVLLPLAQGGQLLSELSTKTLGKLPSDYMDMVDSKSWEEEDLINRRDREKTMVNYLSEINSRISKLKISSDLKRAITSRNNLLVIIHEANAQQYETILQNLYLFDSYSPSIFSEIQEIGSAVAIGLSKTKGAWDSATKSFKVDSEDIEWATLLSSKYAVKDLSEKDRTFVSNLQEQYGFDVETAKLILQVKDKVDEKFPDKTQMEKDYMFKSHNGKFFLSGTRRLHPK